MDLVYFLGLAVTGFLAGMMGALLGLGGGVFIVPALVLGFNVPTLVAVGTSNVAVVATSTAGASAYVRNRFANIRLALVLLVSTTFAALLSAYAASLLPDTVLRGLFVVILLYVSFTMLRGGVGVRRSQPLAGAVPDPVTEEKSQVLAGAFYDPSTRKAEAYEPERVPQAMGVSLLAGIIAGLLGVGGGIVQVPVMNMLMRIPLKAATATSNFMIGMTATASAFVRYAHGDVFPLLAVPTALFVFLGARAGAWMAPRLPTPRLRAIFGWVAILIAMLMALQAVGVISTGR